MRNVQGWSFLSVCTGPPSTVFVMAAQCQNTTGHPPPYGLHPHWRILRCTQQQGAQWLTEGKSAPWVSCVQLGMYNTNTKTHWKSHTIARFVQIRLLPIFTEHGQVGMALRTTRDRGQFVSFARWVKPAKIMWNCETCIEKQQEPRDVTRKIWWRSLSPCFYESAPIIQLSRAQEDANIHLGNPLQPTSQIDLIEMHSGFIMHGICTSKTACYILYNNVWWITDYCIRSFTQLSLFEEVHFLIIQIFVTIVFAVLSLDLPCNCIQCYSLSFTCLAFWLCKNM